MVARGVPTVDSALVAVLRTLLEQIKALATQIGDQLAAHADAQTFTSLPRSGTVRDAVCDSICALPWAARLYLQAIARVKDHPHATRILARAWLFIIWQCWHLNIPYDPDKHRASNGSSAEINKQQLGTVLLMP